MNYKKTKKEVVDMNEDPGAVSLDNLTSNLKNGEPWAVRAEAAESLAEIADPKSVDLLKEALNKDPKLIVRVVAAESLAKKVHPSSYRLFFEDLKRSDDPMVVAAGNVAELNFELGLGNAQVVRVVTGKPFEQLPGEQSEKLTPKIVPPTFPPIEYGACSKYDLQSKEHYRGKILRKGQTCSCSKCGHPLVRLELKSIDITPKNEQVKPGEEKKFEAKGIDQYGLHFCLPGVLWAASGGGDINEDGNFLAGHEGGTFIITATYKQTFGLTNITIT